MSGAAESIFEIGANACAVARAEHVAFIVDANGYLGAFVEAAERAERAIIVLAWDFDSAFYLFQCLSLCSRTTCGKATKVSRNFDCGTRARPSLPPARATV
jgi:hypothetical protein